MQVRASPGLQSKRFLLNVRTCVHVLKLHGVFEEEKKKRRKKRKKKHEPVHFEVQGGEAAAVDQELHIGQHDLLSATRRSCAEPRLPHGVFQVGREQLVFQQLRSSVLVAKQSNKLEFKNIFFCENIYI